MIEQSRSALRELNAEQVIAIVLSGVIAGVVTLITSVSFAALMFNGVLAPFVSEGITILVATAVVSGSLFSLFSGSRPVVAMPDDDTAPVLALMVTLVVASFPEGTPAEVLFVTAFGALATAALLTGLVLAALGIFRLGSLVRYLPYSVMGGYFAGAGLLLIEGALRVVSDLPLASASGYFDLFPLEVMVRWLPAVAVAVLIRVLIGRLHQSIAMPVSIFLALVLFYLGAALCGYMPSTLMADGWLVGPFPEAEPSLLNPVLFERFADIQWSLVLGNLSSIGTIIMLSAVSLMLTASGLSLVQRENVDINRELRVAGLANSVSGLSGGLVALPSMGLTELAMTVGAPKSRLVGLVVAAFCALMLFFGMGMIAWFPKAILAGLLIFLGGSLLERWLLEARSQLPGLEYFVVVVIVTVVVAVGFLEGVMVGLLCAIALFVINYSRIDVVRYAMTGSQRRSNVERKPSHESYLKKNGAQTQILKLQGYLFFGTAAALVGYVERRLESEEQPKLRYLALDFAHVTGMDSSAGLSFMKLAQEAAKSNFFLLLTGLTAEMEARLKGDWLEQEHTTHVMLLEDLDRGVEWSEEHMLSSLPGENANDSVFEALAQFLPAAEDRRILLQHLEHRMAESGDVLAKQGDPSDSMFLLETCTASVYLDTESGKMHRIRRAGSGTVFGEVGFYLGGARTASVIIDDGGELYVLHQEANARLEAEYPHIAAALHRFMIGVITRRLQLTTSTLQAVLT